ncbi:MAG: hypothetical protein K2M13_10230 [Muribaculaceae bacterium]|nr:hypothetical protein [Muribaculaceae bacterium]
MKIDYQNKEFITKLTEAVERRLGRKIVSPRDFDFLSAELAGIGSSVSATTLKRIWGYNRDTSSAYRPYQYTITALIRLLGFRSVDDYINSDGDDSMQSSSFIGATVTADELAPDMIVDLSWEPDRRCRLKCIGAGKFEVILSERGKLKPGDIVRFMSLTQNAPLFFNEVIRNGGKERFVYTAGQRTGIRYSILDSSEAAD